MSNRAVFLGTIALTLGACGPSWDLLEPPDEDDGFQVDEGRYTLEPGKEGSICMRLPIPGSYGAGPVFIRGVESRLSGFTHHFFMAYQANSITGAHPCYGDDALIPIGDGEGEQPDPHANVMAKMIFIAAEGEDRYLLPDGYALELKTGLGHFITSHHVLNATTKPAPIHGVFNILTAKREEVAHPINILNCLLQDIHVPPMTRMEVSGSCIAQFDLDLVVLGSHAHQHLRKFEMRLYDGETDTTAPDPFYVSTDWDSPKIVPLKEPLSLRAGQGITFTCDFENTGDREITFGTGDYGEMCAIMSAYAYPKDKPNEVPPSLGTIVFREGGQMPLFDTTDLDGAF